MALWLLCYDLYSLLQDIAERHGCLLVQSRLLCCCVQDLVEEDASLVTGMLQPAHLEQLQDFLKRPGSLASIGEDPSLPSGTFRALSAQDASFRAMSLDDKARTLSLMPPSAAAALLGELTSLLAHSG